MGAVILEGKTMRYDNWRPKNIPVDGPSYLVGRTDERVLLPLITIETLAN